ncbi:MAG: WecB/TagA/CpsF family glycosyltransferase [Spirochaetia bacterium]|nr:WecB/TagA/CpsF family glycosyltransferase [Spirochaetia bacterium]
MLGQNDSQVVGPWGAVSAKEDRDYLLEYKSINLNRLERLDILDVPVDNVTRDEAVAVVLDLIEKKKGPCHVFFADPLKLMRIRPRRKMHFISEQARLILPDGAGIGWAARKLGTPMKERIPMIAFLMDLIRLSVKKEFTIYLLGSRFENLERVFVNLQKSFPGVRIIGRQGGYFDLEREALIKESIRKSAPDMIFLGMGFPVQELWIRENWQHLSKAIIVGVDGAFDILSGKEKKAPDWAQIRGLTWLWRTLSRPLLVDRMFHTFHFFVLTFWRSFRRPKNSAQTQTDAA